LTVGSVRIMTVIGWFELYLEDDPVGRFAPYYDLQEWLDKEYS